MKPKPGERDVSDGFPEPATPVFSARAKQLFASNCQRLPADLILIFVTLVLCVECRTYFAAAFVALLSVSLRSRATATLSNLSRHAARGCLLVAASAAASVLSLINTTSWPESLQAIRIQGMEVVIFVVALVVVDRLDTVRRLLWIFVLLGVVTGTISVVQYATLNFRGTYRGFSRAYVGHIAGPMDGYRLGGPVGDPNYYAQLLLMIIAVAFMLLFLNRRLSRRLVATWALVSCSVALFLTYSRAGFLTLCVTLAIVAARIKPRWLSVMLALVLLIPGVFLVPRFLDRIQTFRLFVPTLRAELLQEPGFRGRVSENLVALRMIADHPLIGIGIGNYQVLYQQYSRPLGIDPRGTPRLAHNLYLETAAETGLAGLTPFVLFLTVVFAALRDAYGRMRSGEAPLAYTCGAAILAYLISALFLSHYIATSLPFWVLCAIALALPGIIDQPRDGRPKGRLPTG